jgi:hypothetical protein
MLIDILFQLVPHHFVVVLVIGVRGTFVILLCLSSLLFGFTTEVNIFKVTALLNG